MERDVLDRSEAAEMLGVCTKTIKGYVRDDGMPTAEIGRTSRFLKEDIIFWMRSKYSHRYKEMLSKTLDAIKKVITRGVFQSEETGVANLPDGTKQIVKGERLQLLKRMQYDEEGWTLCDTVQQGTIRVETITKEKQI